MTKKGVNSIRGTNLIKQIIRKSYYFTIQTKNLPSFSKHKIGEGNGEERERNEIETFTTFVNISGKCKLVHWQ